MHGSGRAEEREARRAESVGRASHVPDVRRAACRRAANIPANPYDTIVNNEWHYMAVLVFCKLLRTFMIERGGHRVDTRDVATRSPGGRVPVRKKKVVYAKPASGL